MTLSHCCNAQEIITTGVDICSHCGALISNYNKMKEQQYNLEKYSGENYQQTVHCGNCGHIANLSIKKGTLVINTSCPNCGCKSLNKKKETTITY